MNPSRRVGYECSWWSLQYHVNAATQLMHWLHWPVPDVSNQDEQEARHQHRGARQQSKEWVDSHHFLFLPRLCSLLICYGQTWLLTLIWFMAVVLIYWESAPGHVHGTSARPPSARDRTLRHCYPKWLLLGQQAIWLPITAQTRYAKSISHKSNISQLRVVT